MKLFMCLVMMVSLTAWAKPKKKGPRGKFEPSVFQVIPQNSPVKEATAKFLLKTPAGFEIDKVKYKIKNAARIFDKDRPHEPINLVSTPQGNELHVSVSKMPPGFYQLYVKVVDKQKKEHDFKTKYKDHAMFIIDESMEVAAPDMQENDKTIYGIDTDNDGIQDHIQRWINQTYSDNLKVKYGLKQLARAQQLDLISANDREKSVQASVKMLDAGICLVYLVGLAEKSKLTQELKSQLLRTKTRIEADMKANVNFSGQSYRLPKKGEEQKAVCDFDPDSL